MRIPLIWLKDYLDIKKTPAQIAESFTSLGLMLDKYVSKDVLDLEHRMDRSDWLSIIGCARDLAAMEGLKLKFPELNKIPGKQPQKDQLIEIKIECPDLVNRFNTRVFRGIKVKKSPKWLSERLEAYGIPSINNIVDITNFVMVELGQPMHAQDISKLLKPEIVIRRAKNNEEITTLLGQKINLSSNCFVLTQDDKATVLGGIVGTQLTAVDENTKDIVLDAGNYDQVNIRKNSRMLKIQNETVLRYDKFLHPKLTEIALERATKLILELAGGEYYQNIDYYPKSFPLKKIKLRFSRIQTISGMEIGINTSEMILNSLGYNILNKTNDCIDLEIPYFRTDIEVEDDVVADILRINNYKNITSAVINQSPPSEITPDIYNFENKLKDILVNLGLSEHITNPLVISEPEKLEQVKLENSFSSERTALRTNIAETLLDVLNVYKKHKITEVGVFEIGRVYNKKGRSEDYNSFEEQRQCLIIYKNENLNLVDNSKEIKRIISGVLSSLEITEETYSKVNNDVIIKLNNLTLAQINAESIILNTENLNKVSKFPNRSKVHTRIDNLRSEDISIILDSKQEAGDIINHINNFNKDIQKVIVKEEFIDDKLGQDKKSLLVRIVYKEKFPEYKEKLIKTLTEKYSISVRS